MFAGWKAEQKNMNQKNSAEQKGKGLLCKDTFDAPSTTTTAYYKPRAEFLVFPSNVNRNGGPAFKVQGPYAYHMYFAHVFCIGYKYSIDYTSSRTTEDFREMLF